MGHKRAHELFVVENETRKGKGFGVEKELGKRTKQESIDRLSALPDNLLIHILSFLDGNMKQPVATCVLSKRFQFLWSELPSLKFRNRSYEIVSLLEFVSLVNRTLLLRTGMSLDHFSADFIHDDFFALDVNAWVLFAVKRNVRTLELKLRSDGHYYTLPQMLYSSSSLECLVIQRCIVAPFRKIEWQSLTEIDFEDVELDERIIQEILSGCPVLDTWEMRDCWGFKRLNLNSRSLHEFFIYEYQHLKQEVLVEISAPYLRSLQFKLHLAGRKLKLTNIPSLVSADVDFHAIDDSEDSMNNTREIFEMIQHVKYVTVGYSCISILSELVVHGWRLPQSGRISLDLFCLGDEYNLPGVTGLLESSPKLEKLVINFCTPDEEDDDKTWNPATRDSLDCCDLSQLKTVGLNNSEGEEGVACEIILTMARILLKRATSLEKMEIIAKGISRKFPSEFAKMPETLLRYPRSSDKAVVVFHR